jgi:CheY-like chemotaxis protein
MELARCEGLREGEWLLATIQIGEQSTAVAGCVSDRGDELRLVFQDRDWDTLWSFANSSGPPSKPPSAQLPAVPIEAPPGSTVLVVDDDADVRSVVCAVLNHTGVSVAAVASAEEAYDELRRLRTDVLVLDWSLPGMTGLELCQRLRKDPRHCKLPILFLTAHTSRQNLVDAFAAGADDFVSKPFRAPELAARVLSLLRRTLMPAP